MALTRGFTALVLWNHFIKSVCLLEAFQAADAVYDAGYDLAIRSTILPAYQNEASAMGMTSTIKLEK